MTVLDDRCHRGHDDRGERRGWLKHGMKDDTDALADHLTGIAASLLSAMD
ncbi:hypothetical protein [Streptomyces avidinii]